MGLPRKQEIHQYQPAKPDGQPPPSYRKASFVYLLAWPLAVALVVRGSSSGRSTVHCLALGSPSEARTVVDETNLYYQGKMFVGFTNGGTVIKLVKIPVWIRLHLGSAFGMHGGRNDWGHCTLRHRLINSFLVSMSLDR